MNSKDRMLELLANKLRKRMLELDKDAARLSLINKTPASIALRSAIRLIELAIENLNAPIHTHI